MSTTWGAFKEDIRLNANKGNMLNQHIPRVALGALNWLETNYSFSYMGKRVYFVVPPGGLEPGPFAQVPNCKTVRFMRTVAKDLVGGGATYGYLTKCIPEDLPGVGAGAPKFYWLDGDKWIWLDSIPSVKTPMEVYYYKYTGNLLDTDMVPPLDFAYNVLLAKAMLLLMPTARQPGWGEWYQPMFNEGLQVVLNAAEEEERVDTDVRWGMYNE